MSKDLLTICLPPTPPSEVMAALDAAMAPFDYDNQGFEIWQGEWDSWHVYGGYDGDGFVVTSTNEADPRLIFNPSFPLGEPRERMPLRWDGGPRGLLDFAATRAPVAAAALENRLAWQRFAAGYPPATSLSEFMARAHRDPAAYPVDRARQDYFEQPVVQAVNASPETRELLPSSLDPVGYFGGSEEDFVQSVTLRVIPKNHLLTLDGHWIDGTSDHWGSKLGLTGDYHQYYRFANDYLENLAPECLVVRARFHC